MLLSLNNIGEFITVYPILKEEKGKNNFYESFNL